MSLTGAARIIRRFTGKNHFTEHFEKHAIDDFKAIRVTGIIPDHDVVIEEEMIVTGAFDEYQSIREHAIGAGRFFAKQRFARASDGRILQVGPNLIYLLAYLAICIPAIRLHFGKT